MIDRNKIETIKAHNGHNGLKISDPDNIELCALKHDDGSITLSIGNHTKIINLDKQSKLALIKLLQE